MPKWLTWIPPLRKTEEMINKIVWDGVFHGRFEDSEAAKRIYREHVEAVKVRVPAQRLLVFNVRDGWEPLCEFLGVSVPTDMGFPHTNESAEMKQALRIIKLIGKLPWVLVAAAILWLAIGLV